MAFADAFSLFGHRAFSSKPTHGRSIYESLVDGMGETYKRDFNGLQQARLYAQSVCMATAQYQLDRALNNRDPLKATELIIQLEQDYQVTPSSTATLPQRRAYLSALMKVSRGNSQAVIEQALYTVLGTDFVSYTHGAWFPFPPSPDAVGVFSPSGTKPKQFTISNFVATVGVPINVPYTLNASSEAPIAGESYTFDPDPRRNIEQVTILAVDSVNINAVFTKSHEAGCVATRPYPFWSSPARHSLVTLKLAAAQDPEKRRLVNELMAKASRGVSQWSIVSDQGSFVLDSATRGILGCTKLA